MNKDYLSMVTKDGWALRRIPMNERTYELCKIAVQTAALLETDNQTILGEVPKELRNEDICMLAVTRDGAAIREVPESVMSHELCYQAMFTNGKDLCLVPNQLRNEEVCTAAVCDDGEAILYVPEELVTENLWRIALRTRPDLVRKLPEQFCTNEMYVYLRRHTQKPETTITDILRFMQEKFQNRNVIKG